jgi:hypothetical protein
MVSFSGLSNPIVRHYITNMQLPVLTLVSLVAAVLAAPAAEPGAAADLGAVLQPRQSCNIASDACYISCRGGSQHLNCSGSYVSVKVYSSL